MRVQESQGYNKEKALEASGLDVELDRLKNATLAWKKAGSPLNSKKMAEFMTTYIKDKKVVGAYLVIESSSDDTRLRPYTVINEVTNGKRKSTTSYQIKEAEFDVKFHTETKIVVNKETGEEKEVEFSTPYKTETITVEVLNKETGEMETKIKDVEIPQVKIHSLGATVAEASKKDEAFKLAKELTEANKRPYIIEITKVVTEGQRYAGYIQYTPSKSAKLGKFIFFVQE